MFTAVMVAVIGLVSTGAHSATPSQLGRFQQGTGPQVTTTAASADQVAPRVAPGVPGDWNRKPGRHGSDWVLGKSHDTFFPMAGFIVPRQVVSNPPTLVEDASHLFTLRPGDMISSGRPDGVGTVRGIPIYFKNGDPSTCTIKRIGTLDHSVKAEK